MCQIIELEKDLAWENELEHKGLSLCSCTFTLDTILIRLYYIIIDVARGTPESQETLCFG